jgi:hypothetical protein
MQKRNVDVDKVALPADQKELASLHKSSEIK